MSSTAELTDGQLLNRFAVERDKAAFDMLVRRHGPMVLRVCQRVLFDAHEAEDAFQATFIVLVRKASSIAKSTSVGSWLYKVAYRIALRAKARKHRRSAQEKPLAADPVGATADPGWRELRPLIDEELNRLPEKYRAPLVLCYLEGKSTDETADRLGWPRGTVAGRLSRGRELLRNQLARRGLVFSSAGLALLLTQDAATAAVPAALLSSTVQAGGLIVAGKTLSASLVGNGALHLSDALCKTMFWGKVTTSSLVAAAITLPIAAWVLLAGAITAPENHSIPVGPGMLDGSPHQIVRTQKNVVYVFAQTTPAANSVLKVYKADQPGTPPGFHEQDGEHTPKGGVNSAAIAIDGQDLIHAVWLNRKGEVNSATFQTTTDRWGAVTRLDSTNWTDFVVSDQGVALAVDAVGQPHAFWTFKAADGKLRIRSASKLGASWTASAVVDDATQINAWHPTIAFAPNGDLLLAWIDGAGSYSLDGTIRTRLRQADGTWMASVALPDTVTTGLDNNPSLLITADGTQHICFCNTRNEVRYWYNAGQGWKGDRQPPLQVTHNPALGPDGRGGLYLYGHGTPPDNFRADGARNLYRFGKPAGSSSWGAWTLYAEGPFDCSVSTRWAQFCHAYPQMVDIAYYSYPPNPQVTLYVGTDGK